MATGKGFISQLPLATGIGPTDQVVLDQLVNGQPVTRRAPLGLVYPFGLTINHQHGTGYTLQLTDFQQTLILMDNPGAMTLTVPPFSSVPFAPGTNILVNGYGAGTMTVAPGAGVTIRTSSTLQLHYQYSWGFLVATDTLNEWIWGGDIL